MSEEHGTVKKAGWGCFGCGLGLLISMLLVCGSIVLGLVWIGSMIPGETAHGSSSPDDPDSLEEEYVTGKHNEKSKIAVVNVRGVIVSDEDSFDSHIAHSRQICLRIRRAASDPDVKALIVNLNTPGGEVVASDEIYMEIKRFRKTGKPAVAMMNTMAASGGYYVACGANKIVANRSTLTGSIGVIISTVDVSGLLDWAKVKPEFYTSGKMKAMLNPALPTTEEEAKVVQTLVMDIYSDFAGIVSEARNIPLEKITKGELGDGRVFDGKQALENGLVDELGYFSTAEDAALELAKLTRDNCCIERYKSSSSLADFLGLFGVKAQPVTFNSLLSGTNVVLPKAGCPYYLATGL